MDRRPGRLEPLAVGSAHDVRVERRIVPHHHDAVAGDAHVELERVHAKGERARERGQGVLGGEASGPAMPLDLDAGRATGDRERSEKAREGYGTRKEGHVRANWLNWSLTPIIRMIPRMAPPSKPTPKKNLYQILGVNRDANSVDI